MRYIRPPAASPASLRTWLSARLEKSWHAESPWPPLRPLSALFGLAARLRRRLYEPIFKSFEADKPVVGLPARLRQGLRTPILKSFRADKPVVSLGNLTVGGAGKTPLCLTLAAMLLAKGFKPAVLSRGYGRDKNFVSPLSRGCKRDKNSPLVVSRGAGPLISALQSGDEPWLMAEALPGLRVVVDDDRARAAKLALAELGADILILDDGFQQLRLQADCRILLIPSHQPFGNRALLPAGPLREPVSGHRRADMLVTTGAAGPSAEAARLAGGRPLFAASYQPRRWRDHQTGASSSPEALSGRAVFAFCGLARPENFLSSLEALKVRLAGLEVGADHQRYDRTRLNGLGLNFLASKAEVMVTTAKDAVKLPRDFPLPVKILDVDLALDRPEEFLAALLSFLQPRQNCLKPTIWREAPKP